MTGSDRLHEIARRIPELASDDVVRRALGQVRGVLLDDIRTRQRSLFGRRTGIMARSMSVREIPRGLRAQVSRRAWYARLWEGSGRRPFVGPAMDAIEPIAERAVADAIEAVPL